MGSILNGIWIGAVLGIGFPLWTYLVMRCAAAGWYRSKAELLEELLRKGGEGYGEEAK